MSKFSGSLVTAIAFDGDSTAPAEIIFIPEGKHRINPLSHPKGVFIHVPADKGPAIAAALDAKLKERMAENVAPWFDIEHTRKFPASGYPTAFRYEPGKGIMAAVEWSGSGRQAIEAKDARYFSPEFYVDSSGIPIDLPKRGPLGGLVTEPAFREIGPIAASDAGEDNDPNHPPIMSELIFAALSISASADTAEQDAVKAIESLKSENDSVKASMTDKEKEIAELKEKITAMEDEKKKALEARAADKVQAAIADGRILAKDEETANKFREKIAAGDAFAEEILDRLPKQHAGMETPLVQAAAGVDTRDTDSRVTAAMTKARAELGESAEFQHVWARAAEIDPKAFEG